jgi:hypothetical protein
MPKLNLKRSWKYYLKRLFFREKIAWVILIFHISVFVCLFLKVKEEWFFGMQREIIRGPNGGHDIPVNPTIKSINDFFACVLPNLVFFPIFFWNFAISPISWLFWWSTEEVTQKSQKDGTDAFFIVLELSTSRRQIFWGKMFFLVSSLVSLYLIAFALPFSLLLWKLSYFSNFTWIQLFLFQFWNFLITPLFFFLPLVVLLFSLASLNSIWYFFAKWFIRLSLLTVAFFTTFDFQLWNPKVFNYFLNHPSLTVLIILGVINLLALLATQLAYKNFQKRDLN